MEGVPIEKQKFEFRKDDVTQMIPGIDPYWVEDMHYLSYYPPPSENECSVREEWIETMEFIIEDLSHLLKLAHHQFWSQIMHDRTVHECLISYLSNGPRFHDMDRIPNKSEVQVFINKIHRLVFMVYLRMSTYKESKTEFITKEYFAKIIYDNFIFDIPKLMDLCVLYGKDNKVLLQKMISNVFQVNQGYFADLSKAMEAILNVFDNISHEIGVAEGPQDIPSSTNTLKQMNIFDLEDKILFAVDTCASLSQFLDVFPDGYKHLDADIYAPKLSHFYENVVMVLAHELVDRSRTEDEKLLEGLQTRISYARGCLVNTYRNILVHVCIQPILENSQFVQQNGSINSDIDTLLQILSTSLSDKRFLRDYHNIFSILEDMDIIQQAPGEFDQTRVDYIIQGIRNMQDSKDISNTENQIDRFSNHVNGDLKYEFEATNEDAVEDHSSACASSSKVVSGVELDSLISQVKDLLPDLGIGFIEACLDYYSYNSEDVINAVLESNLAPVLQSLDQSDNSRKKEPPKFESELAVLETRANIYNNDEFDMFNNPEVDMSRIHIGKKNTVDSSVLNDKEAIKTVSNIYQRFTNVMAAGDEEDQMFNLEYEDEYDDTYDSNLVGSTEPDAEEYENMPFTTPRILMTRSRGERMVHEEESDGEQKKKNLNFVQNPAMLREQAEQKQAEQKRQSKIQINNQRPSAKGKPRGQGQDTGTLKTRASNEKNKSMRANHNRRNLSDKKQSKGMFG